MPSEESLDVMLGDLTVGALGAFSTDSLSSRSVTPVGLRLSAVGRSTVEPPAERGRCSIGSLGAMSTKRKSIEKLHSWTAKKETTPPALAPKFPSFAARCCRPVSLRDLRVRVLAKQQGELNRLWLQQQVVATELAALRLSSSSVGHAVASEPSM